MRKIERLHLCRPLALRHLLLLAGIVLLNNIPVTAQDQIDTITTGDSMPLSLTLSTPTDTTPDYSSVDTTAPSDSIPSYYYRVNGRYLRTYWTDFKAVGTAPARWTGKDWRRLAIIGGTAGLLMWKLDKPIKNFVQDNRNGTLNSATKVFYPLGNRVPPLLLSGMYLAGVITKERRLEHTSLVVAKSLAISTVFYTASKALIRRQRPDATDNPHRFAKPFTPKYTGFPSGHSNTAFAVATAFVMEFPEKKWVPWVAYPLAAFTALDRLYQNRHWMSDIVIGASIGHFVTRTIYKMEAKRRAAPVANY